MVSYKYFKNEPLFFSLFVWPSVSSSTTFGTAGVPWYQRRALTVKTKLCFEIKLEMIFLLPAICIICPIIILNNGNLSVDDNSSMIFFVTMCLVQNTCAERNKQNNVAGRRYF